MSRIEVFKVMAEMRTWPDSEQCIRALLLSTYAVDMFDTPQKFKAWFKCSRTDLDGKSIADLVESKEWRVLSDYIDDALTGSP